MALFIGPKRHQNSEAHSKVTEDVVTKVEDPSTRITCHGDEVTHVSLNVDLTSVKTGHWSPSLVHGAGIQQTKRSVGTISGKIISMK